MLGLIAITIVAQLQPSETQGAIYDYDDGRKGAKLFDIVRRVEKTPSGWAASMEFRDASGVLAVEERVDFGSDIQPVRYWRRQHQTGSAGTVVVHGSRIQYEWRTKRGRVYHDHETAQQDLMIGPMMFAYFQHHWARIRRGETLTFRIMVPDRRTSYEFELEKVGEVTDESGRYAKCELRLTGFIGLFVGDMIFYLDAEDGNLVRYTGMVLPKVRDGSGWTNVKGMVQYFFPGPDDLAQKAKPGAEGP